MDISKKCSATLLGKQGHPVSNETKEKLSLSRSKILEEKGVGGFTDIKWYKIKNIQDEEFVVRGSWEKKVADWLNNNHILWIRKIYIKYIDSNGCNKTYCPDFFLPEKNLYIEVKGYFSQVDKDKINCVITQTHINLVLLFDKNIRKLQTANTIEELIL